MIDIRIFDNVNIENCVIPTANTIVEHTVSMFIFFEVDPTGIYIFLN
jgi:hypothetical protein